MLFRSFECILRGVLVALGANMHPKASQKVRPREGDFAPMLALGRDLGPLGAQELILSIFDRFLINFYRILVDFLDDFSMIFR